MNPVSLQFHDQDLQTKTPTIDVLIVSFSRDAEWFRSSVAVLEKNLTGYRQIIAVAPIQDKHLFDPIAAERKAVKMEYIEDWPGAGYYWQQNVKLHADIYSDADIICHVDSDVFIKEHADVSEFFSGGKPAWLWAYYTDLDGFPWKAPTEKSTGLRCPQEFMQGFPFFVHRSTYQLCRNHIQITHGRTCEQYVRECAPLGGTAFSEFNTMGRLAWEFQKDLYQWVDRNREEWPKGYHKSRQFWSHAPLHDCLPEINQMITGEVSGQLEITRKGFWVISNDTHISKWAREADRLDFDTVTLARHCKHIKPGDTVVDVGACIGDNTIAYARATAGKDTGQVLAFEPNPTAFAALKRNMAPFSHVQCYNMGLSNAHKQMTIALDPNAGASHLKDGVGIQISTLDTWKLPRLAFMKIDAEGMELQILKGAIKTIERCKPVMYIEINRGALVRAGTSPEEVRTWLEHRGYVIQNWIIGSPQFDITCKPF